MWGAVWLSMCEIVHRRGGNSRWGLCCNPVVFEAAWRAGHVGSKRKRPLRVCHPSRKLRQLALGQFPIDWRGEVDELAGADTGTELGHDAIMEPTGLQCFAQQRFATFAGDHGTKAAFARWVCLEPLVIALTHAVDYVAFADGSKVASRQRFASPIS